MTIRLLPTAGAVAALLLGRGGDCSPTHAPTVSPQPTYVPSPTPTHKPTAQPTHTPSQTPTPLPTRTHVCIDDTFARYDNTTWTSSTCSGCYFSDSSFFVTETDTALVSTSQCTHLTYIDAQFSLTQFTTDDDDDGDDDLCNGPFIMVSTSADQTFSTAYGGASAKFVWNCGVKTIIGTASTASVACHYRDTYTVSVTLGSSSVSFYDSFCGVLTLDGEGIGGSDGLYVYVGGVIDYDGYVQWNYMAAYGRGDGAHSNNNDNLTQGGIVGVAFAALFMFCVILAAVYVIVKERRDAQGTRERHLSKGVAPQRQEGGGDDGDLRETTDGSFVNNNDAENDPRGDTEMSEGPEQQEAAAAPASYNTNANMV